ncbi:cerebroside-sulfatase [Saccharobesus litoralis]|uniref:Cerebroside-sulfatase n=1 Tax=Saccharobesus litoralis TaxID=2172099 RepID=A0A2S0VMN3_9ALTE|nr:sulfatase [Saccharobesus litoralis]AWB65481.1 cerebroside-sulfatase [Saccharobesus litoralis]
MALIFRFIALSLFVVCCYAQATQPNVVVIFTDDQGYADLSGYGAEKIKTPNLDALAKSGVQLNSFYVASSVCSASRAALLTGRRPVRNGVTGVYFPDRNGMKQSEVTIAEVLKNAGYATAAIGKWHLGDKPQTLPTAQGFDYYWGVPFSNDMYIGHTHQFAQQVKFNQGYTLEKAKRDQQIVKKAGNKRALIKQAGIKELVPIFEGEKIVEYPAEQASLSRRFVDKTINFFQQNPSQPVFVYMTPAMPHVPLFASPEFKGKSAGGLYGDTLEELDFHIGRLVDYLTRTNKRDNTLIIFASDNGPWLGYKDHAGSAKPYSHGKFTNYEGGIRVPGIISWPSRVKANQISQQVVTTLDLMPTIAYYAKASLPNKVLDGHNLAELLEGKQGTLSNPHFLSFKNKVAGVIMGDWKYIKPMMAVYGKSGRAPNNKQALLFNIKNDPAEQNNLLQQRPDKVQQLQRLIVAYEQTL